MTVTISFTTPGWLADYAKSAGRLPDPSARMAYVIEASRRNVLERTGGPFAAAVFNNTTGELVAIGTNIVTTQNISALHAEIVAITIAQRILGTYDLGKPDLGEHQLVASTEPCAMCLGAIVWSGVRSVLTAATDADARAIGFDEGPKVSDWIAALQSRGIAVTTQLGRGEAGQVLQSYARAGGEIYNSRQAKSARH